MKSKKGLWFRVLQSILIMNIFPVFIEYLEFYGLVRHHVGESSSLRTLFGQGPDYGRKGQAHGLIDLRSIQPSRPKVGCPRSVRGWSALLPTSRPTGSSSVGFGPQVVPFFGPQPLGCFGQSLRFRSRAQLFKN